MGGEDKVNILLVDDQPAKLLSYETILAPLEENLIKASSAREALELLLKNDVAVLLVDVCMPELDGFELAALIREHPRFQKTAIIFISAIHLTDVDRLRAYEMGAVDYVPVPVIPEVLRAKVKIFVELNRKTRQLEMLNEELEQRVAERTAALEASTSRLIASEQRRTLALLAGRMGSWDWDRRTGECVFDDGQCHIFGIDRSFTLTGESLAALIEPEDWAELRGLFNAPPAGGLSHQVEFRVRRPDGTLRWCIGAAAAGLDGDGSIESLSGVTIDITDRKEAEDHQALLAREVDHRARNALALVQSIVRLTQAGTVKSYISTVEGRIGALSRAHTLLAHSRWHGADLIRLVEEELAPYHVSSARNVRVSGPSVVLEPHTAQALALALHELSTNAAKYGGLSVVGGAVELSWTAEPERLVLHWHEKGGPAVERPASEGFGLRVIGSGIERQLGGEVAFDWHKDGVRCRLSIPFRRNANSQPGQAAAPDAAEKTPAASPQDQGEKVLLVEDEMLVGLMMRDMLADLGFSVVGPRGTLAAAMAAARDGEIDLAVLDVNLGGELVYPAAEILSERQIPFVFVTGYGAECLDGRFTHIPILKKPIHPNALKDALNLVQSKQAPDLPARGAGTRPSAVRLA